MRRKKETDGYNSKWDYTGTGVTMDVIWDFYLGPAPGYVIDYSDTFTHELMVWIGRTSEYVPISISPLSLYRW